MWSDPCELPHSELCHIFWPATLSWWIDSLCVKHSSISKALSVGLTDLAPWRCALTSPHSTFRGDEDGVFYSEVRGLVR